MDARWTVKVAKAKPVTDGKPTTGIATPVFGYKGSMKKLGALSALR